MALTKEKLIERWEQVAAVLEGLPEHEKERHFVMCDWGNETDCGTVACAAGHCAMNTWFRRRGFSAELVGEKGSRYLEPTRGRDWAEMVEDFFGVPESDDPLWPLLYAGVSIFYDGWSRPVDKVVSEVRAFIRRLREEYP